MNLWKIRIVWSVDGAEVVQANAEFAAVIDEEDRLINAVLVANTLSVLNDEASSRILRLEDGYDERATTISLVADGRTRSLTVKDRMAMPCKEAESCAHTIMEWLTGEDMEMFLRHSASPSRRR